jgi:hypothetical protein
MRIFTMLPHGAERIAPLYSMLLKRRSRQQCELLCVVSSVFADNSGNWNVAPINGLIMTA